MLWATNLARVAGRFVLEEREPGRGDLVWRFFSGRVWMSKTVFTAVGEEAERTSAKIAAFFMW